MREALPLLSSYFYSEQVHLEPTEVEVGDESSDEYERFAGLLHMRHAVACGLRLKPIIEAIERGSSSVSEIVRTESKGAINGRLDIQLYLNRRSTNLSWPRTFPVLIARDTPNTPENQLVADTLRQLVRRLNESGISETSAERTYCLNLLRWTRGKLHSEPWSRVLPSRSAERLRRETDHRLRKRQTGNEPAYSQFLDWFTQWQLDAAHIDAEQAEDLIKLLMAFPPGDFFEDRVFEIWCLHQVIEAFRRSGATFLAGPQPLSERSAHPICEMQYNDFRFSIWFQRSLPTAMARWQYLHSGQMLGGIPDITVLGDGGPRLLIDAKRRLVVTPTRSEETYKMLGYLENFRGLYDTLPFYGTLCFLSDTDLFTEVTTERGDHLFLVGAHPNDPAICALGGRMDTVVSQWLSLATGDGSSTP
jgi:hypothetical protein